MSHTSLLFFCFVNSDTLFGVKNSFVAQLFQVYTTALSMRNFITYQRQTLLVRTKNKEKNRRNASKSIITMSTSQHAQQVSSKCTGGQLVITGITKTSISFQSISFIIDGCQSNLQQAREITRRT